MRLSREIAAQPALAGVLARELHPGPGATSDAAIDAFIRDTVHSGNANVGSCSMGADSARGNAVVDPSLRVFGVRGLAHRGCLRHPRHTRCAALSMLNPHLCFRDDVQHCRGLLHVILVKTHSHGGG